MNEKLLCPVEGETCGLQSCPFYECQDRPECLLTRIKYIDEIRETLDIILAKLDYIESEVANG